MLYEFFYSIFINIFKDQSEFPQKKKEDQSE